MPESVNWTLGRLILWSNDLLHTLVGEGPRTNPTSLGNRTVALRTADHPVPGSSQDSPKTRQNLGRERML